MNHVVIYRFGAVVLLGILANQAIAQPPSPTRIRREYNSLTASQKTSFARGVQVMKSRPSSDPTSWQFQANIHGVPGPSSNPLHKQCAHGNANFLVWHRGYLYYFERILRDASGDPTLTLPYWDWPNRANLPSEFRLPAASTNPLFEPGRFLNSNGSMLNASLLQSLMSTANRQTTFSNFQARIESPHGQVHVMVGGRMGAIDTSANDPIFWLHHANVDRKWDQWLAALPGRQNPTSPSFLNQTFRFADIGGATVTVRARDILYSQDLNYRYDDVFGVAEMMVALNEQEPERMVLATSASMQESVEKTKLVFEEKRVTLNFEPDGLEAISSAIPESIVDEQERLLLRVKGIRFKETPIFTYGVYLNLPKGEKNERRMEPHLVGALDFFTGTQNHGENHTETENDGFHQFDQTIDLTETIVELKRNDVWDPKKIEITIVPIAPIPPKDQEAESTMLFQESAQKADISYEKIEIVKGP